MQLVAVPSVLKVLAPSLRCCVAVQLGWCGADLLAVPGGQQLLLCVVVFTVREEEASVVALRRPARLAVPLELRLPIALDYLIRGKGRNYALGLWEFRSCPFGWVLVPR